MEELAQQHVLTQVFKNFPIWVARDVQPSYEGNWNDLVKALEDLHSMQSTEREALFAGLVLLHLGTFSGRDAFLRALANEERRNRFMALDQLKFLSHDPAQPATTLLPAEWAPLMAAAVAETIVRDPDADDRQIKAAFEYLAYRTKGVAHQHLLKMRAHAHPDVFGPAIAYFMSLPDTEGTLRYIADRLLEPNIHDTIVLRGRVGPISGHVAQNLCGFVRGHATSPKRSESQREEAVELAHRVLSQCLASDDASERLRCHGRGWVYTEHLMDALVSRMNPARQNLLNNIAADARLEAAIRAGALARLHSAGCDVTAVRDQVVSSLLGVTGSVGRGLKELAACGLVTFEVLLQAVRLRELAFDATEVLESRDNSPDDQNRIVEVLMRALSDWSNQYEEQSVFCVCELLTKLPRTADDSHRIRSALERTIVAIKKVFPEAFWLVDDVKQRMKDLGV